MYEKLIKHNTKKIYIALSGVALTILIYNFYQKYSAVKTVDYSNLKSQINNIMQQNQKLEREKNKKQQTFKLVSSKLIDKIKLQKDITMLCDNLVKTGYITQANILEIDVPYKYLNVAKISIKVGNGVDVLILKRMFNKLYNIKSIQNNNNNLIIEIYKEA